ncbi:TlpA family protein disulfide reductase [Martelella alba]|uniref:TlpA family protein disulfide reductase n=1 Tax=Martelella alba TaxID=2590451 RepID=A0ABY2SI77_9HYPH|nr:TlpA disulfide reductase family protein [Martelella alba]TKI04773.1 TlpA family protein disulfide reductase [Martelella alba]
MKWHRNVSLICLLALAALLAGCKQQEVSIGSPAPSLAAFDIHGQAATLEKWRGRPVYLTFWSASCGGCAAELAALQKLTETYGERVVVVAVNTDPQQKDISRFLGQLHLTFPVVRDQLGITQERYKVVGTPTAYFINGRGTVVAAHEGAQGEDALAAMFRETRRDQS